MVYALSQLLQPPLQPELQQCSEIYARISAQRNICETVRVKLKRVINKQLSRALSNEDHNPRDHDLLSIERLRIIQRQEYGEKPDLIPDAHLKEQ